MSAAHRPAASSRAIPARGRVSIGTAVQILRVSFDVAADAYDRYMGRYSLMLAPQLADFAGVRSGQRVLDVGCGPGALTAELVMRAWAVCRRCRRPVGAIRRRRSGALSRRRCLQASAEGLPFPDLTFDAAVAQLVVHFMPDPNNGLREMARVSRRDGVVAACVWDHAGDQGPLSLFWSEARSLDPEVEDESQLPGVREGHLAELFEAAGLHEIEATVLWASVEHASFDAWWEPFTKGVGPAGSYLAGLSADRQVELRETVPSHGPRDTVRGHRSSVGRPGPRMSLRRSCVRSGVRSDSRFRLRTWVLSEGSSTWRR